MDGRIDLRIMKLKLFAVLTFLLLPMAARASFIESTMGAAVVNDATAIFYNPGALSLLKNTQIIGLNSSGYFHSQFEGEAQQVITGFEQLGKSDTRTHYNVPSFYLAIPANKHFAFGFAVISNFFNKDLEGHSILRYNQANNNVKNVDFVSALEFKFNEYFSLGANVNFSYADFLQERTFGFPSLNVPDSLSRNDCIARGIGGDLGFLLKPSKTMLIGFNYRSAVTYRFHGTSVLETDPALISNNYGYTFWTPARSVLSVNQAITSTMGVFATTQYIQWSIFNELHIHDIATLIGPRPAIINATVPYHLKDSWILTLGSHYRIIPKCILRIAGTYNQSPGNSNVQVSNGDSIILGGSIGYDLSKNITLDAGYAHAFIQSEDINISSPLSKINGKTSGDINVFSLKLTFNL